MLDLQKKLKLGLAMVEDGSGGGVHGAKARQGELAKHGGE